MLAFSLLLATAASPPLQEEWPPQEELPLELRVNHAIARGVRWLRGEQKEAGWWDAYRDVHPGGMTALAALTLLESGVRPDDAALRKALEHLRTVEWKTVYAASVFLMLVDEQRDRTAWMTAAEQALELLVASQTGGVWAYPHGAVDLSNAQFALLGLRAADRIGLEVPEEVLEEYLDGVWPYQHRDGGFAYHAGGRPSAGMTVATLGGIAVVEQLGEDSRAVQRALRKRADEREEARRWMERHLDLQANHVGAHAWTPSWHYPHLWAVERYAGFTGRARIAGRDWYREGAEWLLARQAASGCWDKGDARALEDTCFALLFLRRATVTRDERLALLYEELDEEAAGRQRPRLDPAVPRVTDWLLAGPWRDHEHQALLREPPFRPGRARRPRARGRIAREEWERVALKADGWTDLEAHTGKGGDRLLWALATEVRWDAPAGEDASGGAEAGSLEAALWFAFEDGWSVWWDGEEVSRALRVRAPISEDVRVPLRITPGAHVLLVLCEDDGGASAFSCRLATPDGKPLPAAVRAGVDLED